MPPSGELARLEQLRPGITDEWFDLVKRDTDAEITRKETESQSAAKLSDAEIKRADAGQSIALFLALICITASIVFFAIGNPWAGGFFLSVPVLQLVQTFIPRK